MDNMVLSLCFWDSDGGVGPVQWSTQSKYETDYSLLGIKGTKRVLVRMCNKWVIFTNTSTLIILLNQNK